MSQSTNLQQDDEQSNDNASEIYRDYVLDVRIIKQTDDDETIYRFEAPNHEGEDFTDPDAAELYADVYFDVNGFDEQNVGEQGIPLEIVQAGRDTLVAYLMTWPSTDIHWVGSFSGRQPGQVRKYIKRLEKRAESIRKQIVEQGVEEV